MFDLDPNDQSASIFRANNVQKLAEQYNEPAQRKLYESLCAFANNSIPENEFDILDPDMAILHEPVESDTFDIFDNQPAQVSEINEEISSVVINESDNTWLD